MDTIIAIKAFLETVDSGGFSAAARKLDVVPSVVMKRVNYLEHITKKKLLVRSTRSIELTEEGMQHLQELRAAVAGLDLVINRLRHEEKKPRGLIRIGAPPAITTLHFSRIFSEFAIEYPDIRIGLTLIDRSMNPVNHDLDIVIGGFLNTFPDIIDIPLFPLKRMICGSSDYLSRHGIPTDPSHLFSHRLLALTPMGTTWEFRGPSGPIRIEHSPVMFSNDAKVLCDSAIAGNGLAMLPGYVCKPYIHTGDLVEVLDLFPIAEMWFKAFVSRKLIHEDHVKTFLEWFNKKLLPVPPWEHHELFRAKTGPGNMGSDSV